MNNNKGDFTLRVRVTKADIANGTWGMCGNCPVALAVRRALKRAHKATKHAVGTMFCTTYLYHDNIIYWMYSHSQTVSNFITAFDSNDSVVPFTFSATFYRTKEVYDTEVPIPLFNLG